MKASTAEDGEKNGERGKDLEGGGGNWGARVFHVEHTRTALMVKVYPIKILAINEQLFWYNNFSRWMEEIGGGKGQISELCSHSVRQKTRTITGMAMNNE